MARGSSAAGPTNLPTTGNPEPFVGSGSACYDARSLMVDLVSLAGEGTEEMAILREIDFSRLPRHVAIIMDGNGRWAGKRHLPRVAGHRAGIASVRDVVEASARLGLEVITLYAFSKENWKRPRAEVDTLMELLREYLRRELETLHKNGI